MSRSDEATFNAELFARLAREELSRGAVWMAEMTARLALALDATNAEYQQLVKDAEVARRRRLGEAERR